MNAVSFVSLPFRAGVSIPDLHPRAEEMYVVVTGVLMAAAALAVSALVRHAGQSEVHASLWFDEVRRAFAGLPGRFSS